MKIHKLVSAEKPVLYLYFVKGCRKRHHKGETEYIPVLMNVCCFSFTIWWVFFFMLHTDLFQHWMEMICCNLREKFILMYCTPFYC